MEAAAEKYNFLLDSFFWFVFTLFNKTLISVLFDRTEIGFLSRYLLTNFSLTAELKFFMLLFNHLIAIFANLSKEIDKYLEHQEPKLGMKE